MSLVPRHIPYDQQKIPQFASSTGRDDVKWIQYQMHVFNHSVTKSNEKWVTINMLTLIHTILWYNSISFLYPMIFRPIMLFVPQVYRVCIALLFFMLCNSHQPYHYYDLIICWCLRAYILTFVSTSLQQREIVVYIVTKKHYSIFSMNCHVVWYPVVEQVSKNAVAWGNVDSWTICNWSYERETEPNSTRNISLKRISCW